MNHEAFKCINWFHQIDLGNGYTTPGPDFSAKKYAALNLPDNMNGMTVLDVGAWDGYFSFECERRGAKVTATDYHVWNVPSYGRHGFYFAKNLIGSKVEDKLIAVEDLSPDSVGTHDIVLFLGVLYHSPDPLGYLRRIRSVTKNMAVIETYVDLLDIDRPALAYYEGASLNNDPTNFFGPNSAAVIAMCKDAGFSRIEIVNRDYLDKTRMVFHAFVT